MLYLRLLPAMKIGLVLVILIASVVLTNTVRFRRDKKRFMRAIAEQSSELQQTRQQLQETRHRLVSAESKLGFLDQHKTAVQVTAFTGQGNFANGAKVEDAYAVPTHVLPQNNVLSIALSPLARRRLRARLNDYIVLLDREGHRTRLARFVDKTAAHELRPVIDIFFAREEDARLFGRQRFMAVNISGGDSPFQIE